MKKTGVLTALTAAVTATSASVSSSSTFNCNSNMKFYQQDVVGQRDNGNSEDSCSSSDKFAPRFDGLRFIETLVTAHR